MKAQRPASLRVQPRLVAPLLVAAASFCARPAAAEWPRRDGPDLAVVARLKESAPRGGELLEKGEALAAAGSFEQALEMFRAGKLELPNDGSVAGLFMRRECEVLTSLDRRAEATKVCWEALQQSRSMSTIGAAVRTLVTGPTPPTLNDLKQAIDLVALERRHAPDQPVLLAAMCDLAESTGDGVMLQNCAHKLEEIDPNYGPTVRARREMETTCPPWLFRSGWTAIASGALLTAGDGLRRWLKKLRARRGLTVVAAAILAAGIATAPKVARADLPPAPPGSMLSIWPVDDKNPESSIPSEEQRNAHPLEAGYWLQDLIYKAKLASKHGDHEAAIRYYEALHKTVPDKAVSLLQICQEYEAMGDLDQAANECGLALTLDGVTINDYVHYVRLVLRQPGALTDKELMALGNVIDHLKQDTGDDSQAAHDAATQLGCELAARLDDVPRLKECTTALAATAPNDARTLSYEWALAAAQKNFGRAEELLVQAKAAGVPEDKLKTMQAATDLGARKDRRTKQLVAGGVGAVLGGVLLALVARLRKRRSAAPAAPASAA